MGNVPTNYEQPSINHGSSKGRIPSKGGKHEGLLGEGQKVEIVEIIQILKEENMLADRLAGMTSKR